MVSVCLPSDALSQHLPSYLGFFYLGRGVSLHGCSSKAQLLLLTLDEGYLLTVTPPDLERGVAPLGPPVPTQLPLLGHGVAPLGCHPWPRAWGSSFRLLLCRRRLALSVAAPDLGQGVAPLSLSVESLKILFLVSLEAEPGLCPKAALLFPGCSSFVSASSPFPDEQLFKSPLRNSGKVLEAGVCSLQTRNGGHGKAMPRSPTGSCWVS